MKKKFLTFGLCLLMLGAFFVLPPVLQAATAAWTPTTVLSVGEQYMFVAPGISDCNSKSFPECVVKSVVSADPHGLDYCAKPSGTVPADCLWTLEQASGNSYYLRSSANGQYLNMAPGPNGKGYATLSSTKQALNLVMDGGKVKISATLDGAVYYVRFTNTYAPNSCWEAGTATSSGSFTVYAQGGTAAEYKNTTDPLFTVACFADLHIDYGIQSYNTPIRPGTINAANFVRNSLGPADVVLVGGDITSNNGGNRWNTNLINKSRDTVYETMSTASKNGKVMLITGNHDNEAGTVSTNGDVIHSGDYDKYMTENIGTFTASLRFNDMGLGSSKYNELLCYRYTVGKMEFIGINTPYRTARSNGYIYLEQIEWMEDQLAQIGKNKTVIVFCHYPIINTSSGILNAPGQSGANAKMDSVLKNYPNVIYCYGHVHGDDSKYAWYNTSELVVPQGPVTKTSSNAYKTNSYITAHMGSMGYYNNQFQPGGLKADEPMINQLLMIDFYSDHITFRYYNTGSVSAVDGVYEISSFTVMRDMSSQLSSSSSGGSSSGSGGSSSGGSSGYYDPDDYYDDYPDGYAPGEEPPLDTDSEEAVLSTDASAGTSTDALSGTVDSDTPEDGESDGTVSGGDGSLPDVSVNSGEKDREQNQSGGEMAEPLPGWVIPVIIAWCVLVLGGAGVGVWLILARKKRAETDQGT